MIKLKRGASIVMGRRKGGKETAIEYLPDADEIERSPLPRFAQATVHALVLSIVLFVVWASVSEIDQIVTAQGRLVNPVPNFVVQPLETSIVKSVDVRVGQVVKQGDLLATLDSTFAKADEQQLEGKLKSLDLQIQGLQDELDGKASVPTEGASGDFQLQADLMAERRANFRAQQLRLAEAGAKLRAALATNRNDQGMVRARLKSMREIEAMQEKVVTQKYGAPLQLLEAQQRTKEVERELDNVVNREQELRRDLAANDAERGAFEKSWRQKTLEDILAATRERDGLWQQFQKADKRSSLVRLEAPVDGVVLEIAKYSPGSIVQGAETFVTLVPLGVKLEAEVQIASGDIGYIRKLQEARIKLDAFPFQRHGTLNAKVRSISEDAFRRDPNAKGGGDAYYISRLVLEGNALRNMTEGTRFIPGMTLNAEIVVGKRTVMSYIAWPLTKGLDEAGREPR